MQPEEFRTHVFDYCLAFSASETSGFRTTHHNRAIGGVPGSPHIAGVAIDVVYDGAVPGEEADRWLRQRGIRRIIEGDHDHLQPIGWKNLPADPMDRA